MTAFDPIVYNKTWEQAAAQTLQFSFDGGAAGFLANVTPIFPAMFSAPALGVTAQAHQLTEDKAL